jgi:hypothetical protein
MTGVRRISATIVSTLIYDLAGVCHDYRLSNPYGWVPRDEPVRTTAAMTFRSRPVNRRAVALRSEQPR